MVVLNNFIIYFAFTCLVRALRAGLHGFPGAWRRCNFSEWNNHSSSLRLLCPSRRLSGMPCTRKTAHSSPFNGGF
ncbi:MAG: hypothetical protein WC091_22180 [Sulfuricellaceae bacterium]